MLISSSWRSTLFSGLLHAIRVLRRIPAFEISGGSYWDWDLLGTTLIRGTVNLVDTCGSSSRSKGVANGWALVCDCDCESGVIGSSERFVKSESTNSLAC